MKLFLVFIFLALAACSTPGQKMPEYPQRWIDRPYTLPANLMKFSAQVGFQRQAVSSKEYSITGKAEAVNYTIPILDYEAGINDDVTYSALLGLKWRIYSDEKHSVGINAWTLLLWSTLSVDYWYRVSESVSLRPYYRASHLNLFVIETTTSIPGLEVLFQVTDNWGLSTYYQRGRYKTRSEFVELIVNGITKSNDFNTELTGTVSEFGLATVYSLNPHWDLRGQTGYARYDLDPLRLHSFSIAGGFNYFF